MIGAFFRALLEDSLQSFSLRLLYSDRQHLPTPPSARAGPIVGYPATVCLAYANGIEVDMDGPLTVQLARCDGQDEPSCVITSLAFDARKHKVRAAIVDRRPRVPAERDWVINAFGMPPAAMRMLDVRLILPLDGRDSHRPAPLDDTNNVAGDTYDGTQWAARCVAWWCVLPLGDVLFDAYIDCRSTVAQ